MPDEKPLHVRVAEALGLKPKPCPRYAGQFCAWIEASDGDHRHSLVDDPFQLYHSDIPRYDTDWSATGPLIERLGLALTPPAIMPSRRWAASSPDENHRHVGSADTALEAVCYLILALAEAGKLS